MEQTPWVRSVYVLFCFNDIIDINVKALTRLSARLSPLDENPRRMLTSFEQWAEPGDPTLIAAPRSKEPCQR